MTTYLLFDDTTRSHELRHEIGESIADPFAFIEHEGRRIVIGRSFEQVIFERREDVVDEFWLFDELGSEDLVRDQSFPLADMGSEIVLRGLQKLGVARATVPASFRVAVADYLRAKGIELDVDQDAWDQRRRRKAPWELEGQERAQRAAETAMVTAARMLRDAEPTNDGRLRFEGEILTAELIRIAMVAELLSQGCESEEILVQSGDACLETHDLGMGPIIPDASVVIDVFPRDRRTGVHSDMTRTFVPGEPSDELGKLHADCRRALDIAFEAIRPGTSDAYQKVAEFFASRGYPTQLTYDGPAPMREGFNHSLGHGVGLEVHERPYLGRRGDAFEEGDVIAVEPGLYFAGIGGVRLEDTVIVTATGIEHFTDPYPYDLSP